MKDKKIVNAIRNAILNDIRRFEEAMDTCVASDFASMVRDTSCMYRPILSDDLAERAQNLFEKTPPGVLVSYCMSLSGEVRDCIDEDRIDEVENVQKVVRSLTQFPPFKPISERRAKIMAEILQTLSATLE